MNLIEVKIPHSLNMNDMIETVAPEQKTEGNLDSSDRAAMIEYEADVAEFFFGNKDGIMVQLEDGEVVYDEKHRSLYNLKVKKKNLVLDDVCHPKATPTLPVTGSETQEHQDAAMSQRPGTATSPALLVEALYMLNNEAEESKKSEHMSYGTWDTNSKGEGKSGWSGLSHDPSRDPWDRSLFSEKEFKTSCFENLPPFYKLVFKKAKVKKQLTDLQLVVLLAGLSAVFPNYKSYYNNDIVESNLYLALIAPFGSGKGNMRFIKAIAAKIDKRKRLEAERQLELYRIEMKCRDEGDPEPEKPKFLRFLIPANSSAAGFFFIFHDSGGRGAIWESEIDTLAMMFKKDYGNYSDLLRNAYHHEGYSIFRKTDFEERSLDEMYLTVVLSGTFGQFLSLVPIVENGLFSRFTFFEMASDPEFDNVYDRTNQGLAAFFDKYAEVFDRIHEQLESRGKNPVMFELKVHQEKQLMQYFAKVKASLLEDVDESLAGVVHRMSLMCHKIAMILCAGRNIETIATASTLVCEDIDFNNAFEIIKTLALHTLSVYKKMPNPELDEQQNKAAIKVTDDQIAEIMNLHSHGVSLRKIAQVVLGRATRHETVARILKKHIQK